MSCRRRRDSNNSQWIDFLDCEPLSLCACIQAINWCFHAFRCVYSVSNPHCHPPFHLPHHRATDCRGLQIRRARSAWCETPASPGCTGTWRILSVPLLDLIARRWGSSGGIPRERIQCELSSSWRWKVVSDEGGECLNTYVRETLNCAPADAPRRCKTDLLPQSRPDATIRLHGRR